MSSLDPLALPQGPGSAGRQPIDPMYGIDLAQEPGGPDGVDERSPEAIAARLQVLARQTTERLMQLYPQDSPRARFDSTLELLTDSINYAGDPGNSLGERRQRLRSYLLGESPPDEIPDLVDIDSISMREFGTAQSDYETGGNFLTRSLVHDVLDPVANVGWGLGQGALDGVRSIANVFRQNDPWEPIVLKDATRALYASVTQGTDYETELQKQQAQEQFLVEDRGMFMARAGDITGTVGGFLSPTSLPGKIGILGKAVTLPGAVFRGGGAVANKVGSAIFKYAGKGDMPKFAQELLKAGGGFSAWGALTAEGQYDESGQYQNPTAMERAKVAALDFAAGTAVGVFTHVGKKVADKILSRGLTGADADAQQKYMKAMLEWSRQGMAAGNDHGKYMAAMLKMPKDQLPPDLGQRLAYDWVAAGLPGAQMTGRKLAALAAQSTTDAVGFSYLDAEMWADTLDVLAGAWDMDEERFAKGFGNAMDRIAVNAVGLAALRAGTRVHDLINSERRQPDPRPFDAGQPRQPAQIETQRPSAQDPRAAANQEAFKAREQGYQARQQEAKAKANQAKTAENEALMEERFGAHPSEAEARQRAAAERYQGLSRAADIPPNLKRAGWRVASMDPSRQLEFRAAGQAAGEAQGQEPSPAFVVEIPGTGLSYVTAGGTAVPNEALAKALGSGNPVPAEDMEKALTSATLSSILYGRAFLPGVEVSTDGTHWVKGTETEPGIEIKMMFGDIYQRPIGSDKPFKKVRGLTPRQPDHVTGAQESVANSLTAIYGARQDMSAEARVVLDATITALSTVSAERSPGIADTLPLLTPEVLQQMATLSPEDLNGAVMDLAKALTTHHPQVLGQQRAEQAQKAQQEAQAQEPPKAPEEPETRREPPDDILQGEATAYGGVPLPKPVADFGKDVVQAGTTAGGSVVSWLAEPQLSRVAEAGAPDIADTAWDAVTEGKRIHAELAPMLEAGQRLARKRNPEMEKFIERESGAIVTMGEAWKDADIGSHVGVTREGISPETKALLEAWDGLHRETRRRASELGMEIETKDGRKKIAREASRDVMTRIPTQALLDAVQSKGGPVWEKMNQMLAAENGMTLDEAKSRWTEERGLHRPDAIERQRMFKFFPSRVRLDDGKIEQLLESDPYQHMTRLARTASMRLGVVSAFGQGLPPEKTGEAQAEPVESFDDGKGDIPYRSLVDKVNQEHGRDAAQEVANLMRALHGMSLSSPLPKKYGPGTTPYRIARAHQRLMRMWGGFKMSMSGIANMVEPFGTPMANLGVERIMHGYSKVGKAIADGSLGDLVQTGIDKGWFARDIPDWRVRKSGDLAETFDDVARNVTQGTLMLFELSQRFGELVVGTAVEKYLSDMQGGRGKASDIAFVERFGFSFDRARAIAEGRGTPQDYDRIRKNAISTMMGGHSMVPAEQPKSSSSRPFRNLFRLVQFAMRQIAELQFRARKMRAAKTGPERDVAFKALLRFLTANMIAGTMVDLLRRLWSDPELEGMENYMREFASDPATGLVTALFNSVGGAPGAWIRGIVVEGNSAMDWMRRNFAPVAMYSEIGEAALALGGQDGPYSDYNEKDAGEIVWTYGTKLAPMLRFINDRWFVDDPKTDKAMAAFNRKFYGWNPFTGGSGPSGDTDAEVENNEVALSAVRAVLRAIRKGSEPGSDEVVGQLRRALQVKPSEKVAASLRYQRVMDGPFKWGRLTVEQQKEMLEFLGPEQVARLRRYDAVLGALADIIDDM